MSDTELMNPLRGAGLPAQPGLADGDLVTDAAAPRALYAQCPKAHETPLADAAALAAEVGVGALWLKDERGRMGLGSFKALGAAHAIAKAWVAAGENLEGVTFATASAGNHGLSVAAGARAFGAKAVIYIADTVPEAFADRLRAMGADVAREGAAYEAAMAAAQRDAAANGWRLLSDSSWEGYADPARDVMEGYLIMGAEAAEQVPEAPTHIYLQAGVGGLAAAACAAARAAWGDGPRITVVEPDAARALIESIRAGRPLFTDGPVSNMGRLDCKEPSHLALKYLAREADAFMTVTDAEAQMAADRLGASGFATTPSAAAGFAGMAKDAPGPEARVLLYVSEGPEDA
ncbi:MAG: pyridoxal-phosphate dependent enzyme [Pseudomonadota bacterium]